MTGGAADVDSPLRRRRQRKVLQVLAAGQVLGGLGTGASLSLGALLVTGVAGSYQQHEADMAARIGALL